MLNHYDRGKEAELFYEAANGNQDAFSQLYRLYTKILKSFVSKMLAAYNLPRYLDDEVIQDTMVVLSREIKRIKLDANRGLQPWLFTVASNQIRNHVRTQKNFLNLDAVENKELDKIKEILSYNPKIDDNLSEAELKKIINDAIEKHLQSPSKEIFKVLIEFDLTIAELSEYFQTNEGTIKSRLNRARALLAPVLEPLRKYFR